MEKEEEKKILTRARDALKKEKTRKTSIKEGMATSVMSGLGDSYISPFALALGANNAQIGFLSSFPNLLSPASQILGSKLMEKHSRRKIMINFVALHGLMWLPILALGILFLKNIYSSCLPTVLIIFYSLYAIFGAIAGPSWFSLMGDLVPENIRGKYFSRRNRICGAVALLSTLIAAFILDFFKTKGAVLIGFSILFLGATLFRLLSAFLFTKHYYPQLELKKGYYFSFWQFMKKAKHNNFGKFTFYIALMQFATAIAGPFFAVYMLNNLNFSYIEFMLSIITASLFTLLFLPLMGKISDRYGNRKLLRLGSILVPLIPFLWLFSKSHLYLIIVPQIVSGVGWAAFNLSASNFIYDSVSVQRRGLCVAYYSMIVGLFTFLGAGIGGIIAQYFPVSFVNPIILLFILSGIARGLVAINIGKIKEIRKIKNAETNQLTEIKKLLTFS